MWFNGGVGGSFLFFLEGFFVVDSILNLGRPVWFLGCGFGGTGDQTRRFLAEGIWEAVAWAPHADYSRLINDVEVGDGVVLKSSDNNHSGLYGGKGAAVMVCKATGVVVDNPRDGRKLRVAWEREKPLRWLFPPSRDAVLQVCRGDGWESDALTDFVFDGKHQDIGRFMYGEKQGGVRSLENSRWTGGSLGRLFASGEFAWTVFYEAFAEKLLEWRDRRGELARKVDEVCVEVMGRSIYRDKYKDGGEGVLRDICPFTFMGAFNRVVKPEYRWEIARRLAGWLGVEGLEVPHSFVGIPTLNNQKSWLFAYEYERGEGDIEALWELLECAVNLSRAFGDADARSAFVRAYSAARQVKMVGDTYATMGLFWACPWIFLPMDGKSKSYVDENNMGNVANILSSNARWDSSRQYAEQYLSLLDDMKQRFRYDDAVARSFPEVALKAVGGGGAGDEDDLEEGEAVVDSDGVDGGGEEVPGDGGVGDVGDVVDSYGVEDVVREGCFVGVEDVGRMLGRLRGKKNLILQGAPGTGKTWLAKRLAYALIGAKDDSRVRAVQFHPNVSYEDFIRGWRPGVDGKLELRDGAFMELIAAAKEDDSGRPYVMVVEEVNRGNPVQIFGEMLTLLESDKRGEAHALALSYMHPEEERVFVPDNVFVVGTMNVADRSLAMVDLALRRRFAFWTLEPAFNEVWKEWLVARGVAAGVVDVIRHKMGALNEAIAGDKELGKFFCVGHSYVTPSDSLNEEGAAEGGMGWFREVVETEIVPLLEEYWYDNEEKLKAECKRLREGIL